MRRTRLVVLFAILAATLIACNALTGASDLTADLCTDCGEDASVGPVADATINHATPESNDAGVDSPFHGPTFCLGLVLYTTYDDGPKSTVGSSIVGSSKAVIVDEGKFGKGLQAVGTNSTAYYPMDGDGGTLYPEKAGTIAFWFKSSVAVGAMTDRILVKPVIDPSADVNETAPQIRFDVDTSTLGITNQNPDSGYTTAGIAAPNGVPVGYRALDFNHLVGTWNEDAPSLRFWLNGGTTPGTLAENKTQWTPQVSPTGFLRISSSVNPAGGVFDELAVWSRELGANEVAALYRSATPIADACGF